MGSLGKYPVIHSVIYFILLTIIIIIIIIKKRQLKKRLWYATNLDICFKSFTLKMAKGCFLVYGCALCLKGQLEILFKDECKVNYTLFVQQLVLTKESYWMREFHEC